MPATTSKRTQGPRDDTSVRNPGAHQSHHHPRIPLPVVAARRQGVPDNTFDLSHTEVPYDLQEALADVTTTYEQVDSDRFAETLGILGKQLQTLPPVIPQALVNTQTLSEIIAERRDQLGSLLKTTETVTNTLRRQQSTIGSLVKQGNTLSASSSAGVRLSTR